MFRKALITAAAVASFSSVALADSDWTGAYIGVGGSMIDAEVSLYGFTLSESTEAGTIFAGFNADVGDSTVLGLESEYTKLNEDFDFSVFTVRARAGLKVAEDKGLAFVTAGYSNLDVEGYNFDGWTVGAGYEHALTENVHLRAEYAFFQHDVYGLDLDSNMARVGVSFNF